MSKSKNRIKQTGEVFTPTELVNEILNKLPADIINNKEKTVVDPACGNGQFLIEAIKRRKSTKNVFGVDIMADNCCDTIARIIFLVVHNIEIINNNAQFVDGVDNDGHTDHPMYPLDMDSTKFLRYYSYQDKEVVIKIDHCSETGVWFKYGINGSKSLELYPYIVCADSLQFKYDEFDNIKHLDIPFIQTIQPSITPIVEIIEPIQLPEEKTKSDIPKPKKEISKPTTNKDYDEYLRLDALRGTTEFDFKKWDKLRKKFSS